MTGIQLQDLRDRSGFSLTQFSRWLGFNGSDATEKRRIRRLEAMEVIPHAVAVRAQRLEAELEKLEAGWAELGDR